MPRLRRASSRKLDMGLCRTERGFSLIEVNLAIFVVAIGLLSLFTLFPIGLKQGEAGHQDTQTSMFAAYVLDGMRANAMGIGAEEWGDRNNMAAVNRMTGGSSPLLDDLAPQGEDLKTDTVDSFEYPEGADPETFIRYLLEIDYDDVGGGGSRLNLYKVKLWVQGGEYGTTIKSDFKGVAEVYYTELFYSGMP